MGHYKLDMGEEPEEPYTLIAIHCSEEAYKVAYLMNQHLNTRFKRRRVDIDFPSEGMMVTFPIFDFMDEFNYSQYYLVANKCSIAEAGLQSSGGLFSEIGSEKDHFLLPELKKVDYLLKIYSDFETVPLQSLISQINNIDQIVSAYVVETANIKSKNNLIFD
ncbi:IPExxxVDY family protein [Aequorivita todarodis]|uniref:IPExxxVDY family protein n=1 Tax=Aequorivita todarodis TaxID=2036821 RepID=UPI00235027A9|nr:IPExxxVDY family protein [Aequorivita todarodis]MDC8000385.1 IPExxxVDY family protein [Aequorivita todarodis]